MFTPNDVLILVKKIVVGIAVFLVPAVLITGGLTYAAHLLDPKPNKISVVNQKSLSTSLKINP